MGGPPNQFSGQYNSAGLAMNAPPTYAHPYGAMSYPPPYPPVPHHSPYGAGVSAAPFQPWGYAPYPMAPPPGREQTRRDGDVGANDAAVVGCGYPARQTQQRSQRWRPRSRVRIMFQISGEGGVWSDLASEYDWADVIAWLVGKAHSAQTHVVSMEVKDMHKSARVKAQNSKGKGKGKEKRHRRDDIPPVLSPDMTRQLVTPPLAHVTRIHGLEVHVIRQADEVADTQKEEYERRHYGD
ncbi:hypothetical protein EDB84DRAFT_1559811 [Lactarius hengduanensis]|nr:hypothetical protein EDB84DRAFT_1559811 [Lactarius hengduanensis]